MTEKARRIHVWKGGGLIAAEPPASRYFYKPTSWSKLGRERIFSVHTESLRSQAEGGSLKTVFTFLHFAPFTKDHRELERHR